MRTLRFVLVLTVGVLGTAFLPAQADSIDFGPAVGSKIPPTFVARTQANAPVGAFANVTGKNGAVLAFVRSAKWCPYCQTQLKDLQSIAAPLAERGYPLVSISYDTPDVLAAFAAKSGITYTLLSDEGSAIIDAFGIRDPQYKEGSFAYGVPRPAIFIVDASGTVRAKLAEDGYKTRPQIAAIVSAVDRITE